MMTMMMMKIFRIPHIMLSIVLLMLIFFTFGCPELVEEEKNPITPVNNGSDPGPGNLAGKVIGSLSKQPLVGITVAARGKTTTTNYDGTFRLDDVGDGIFSVVLTSGSTYKRTIAANTNTSGGRWVDVDVFGKSNFDLRFYRELARGNHPAENSLFSIRHWATQPTFYIDTNGYSTQDGVVNQEQIDAARDVLSQVIPVFTGGRYRANQIQLRQFPNSLCTPLATTCQFDNIPNNSVVISFDDSLIPYTYGITITEPDFTESSTQTLNKAVIVLADYQPFYSAITFREVVAHEMGHGMGFFHTTDRVPSVMYKFAILGGIYSSADQAYMPVMYSRSPGNTDIDDDPIPGAKVAVNVPGVQMHVDNWASPEISLEVLEEIQALPGRIPYDELQEFIID